MENKAHLRTFGKSMLNMYHKRVHVKKDKPISFFSHAEGHHSGLSGRHFLKTLELEEQRTLLLDLADKLAPFFEKAEGKRIDSHDLVLCFRAFQESLLMIYYDENAKHPKNPVKRLGVDGYNSMDYLRSLYNLFEGLGHSTVMPNAELWEELVKSQSKPKETRDMLKDLGFPDFGSVVSFLNKNKRMNWTTLLVLLCETRQASHRLGATEFFDLVTEVNSNKREWRQVVRSAVRKVRREGAKTSQCFCTRTCIIVQKAIAEAADARTPNDAESDLPRCWKCGKVWTSEGHFCRRF